MNPDQPVTQTTPAPAPDPKPADQPQVDPKTYEELGKLKKVAEDFTSYRNDVDPVLQTLYNDPDLFNEVLDKHNKRLGINTDPTPPKTPDTSTPVSPSQTELDNRQALLTNTFKDFEKEKSMISLPDDARKDLNQRVLGELKDMLDPMGNKTIQQVLNDVSLSKLPRFLEKAYDLATKDEQRQAAMNAGRAEALGESAGIIGSVPSSSISPDQVSLTSKEKEVAKKLGITEEKYLENKKAIIVRNNQPL